MKEIEKYQVVSAENLLSFQENVNSLISNGYQPFGSMTVIEKTPYRKFYQAMVKYKT